MTSLTDEQDIRAAFNLTFMKHKMVDSEEEIEKLEDTKLKSLGQTRKYRRAETKPRALEEEDEEDAVNLEQGLKQRVVQVEDQQAMYAAEEAQPQEGLFYGNYNPPIIPPVPNLHQFIGICSKPFEKQLTVTDVEDHQSRLNMGKEYVQQRLMPLLNENEDLTEGIDVMTYDLAGMGYPMKFRIWSGKIHVLTAGWKEFRQDHALVANQNWVTVWMFRNIATGELCFAIEVRKLPVYETIKRKRRRQN